MGATLLITRSRLPLAAAVALLGCVDSPAGPGRFGQLRVRPSYVAADAPGTIGAGLDSATVRITRPAEADAPLVDTTVIYQSDTASLGWILDLREDAESLRVDLTIWGDTRRLYTGAETVLVHDESFAATGTEPVAVSYVGPPIVASITVNPGDAAFDALGATTRLAAAAYDRHGALVSDAAYIWSSANPAVASVNQSGEITAVGNGTTVVSAASGSITGSATVVVEQRVATIDVTPQAITLTALGTTHTLVAHAADANGHAVPNPAFEWSSDAPAIASVHPTTGVVTALAGGSATVTAMSDGVSAAAAVTVNPIADVASIVVSPPSAVLTAVAAIQRFTAEARDAGGAVLHGVEFTWASTVTPVATVDGRTGVASAVGHGTTQITASAGAVTGSASLVVDLTATIASVEVAPATTTLHALGTTQAYQATARDAGGAVISVTNFAWSTSAAGVATIDAAGIATATGHGSATITATVNGVSGSAALTVDLAPAVASVTVTPSSATLTAVGASQHFTATARDGNGHILPGVTFAWTTGAAPVATVDARSGLATAVGHGSTTITATAGIVSGSAAVTVDLGAMIASVTVAPATATLSAVGQTQQFTAIARDAGGTVVPVAQFAWSSATLAVATVDPTNGVATAVGHGVSTITAAAAGISGASTLTVDLIEVVASVVVTPTTATIIALGGTQQFTAVAYDANGIPVPGIPYLWTSAKPEVASIDPATGLATATGQGTSTITASAGGRQGTAGLTVSLVASVASVTVAPDDDTLTAVGASRQYTAIAHDAAGIPLPGITFTWTSANPAVATVNDAGLAIAAAHGQTTIAATAAGISGQARLTVDLETVIVAIDVTPAAAMLSEVGSTQLFTAVARDASGHVVPVAQFVWSSSAMNVAAIDPQSGIATAARHGSTTIRSAVGAIVGSAELTVDLTGSVVRVMVTPAGATLGALDATQQFTAVAFDASDQVVPGILFSWTSASPSVATIDGVSGVARATGQGTTVITATGAGVTATAVLQVDLGLSIATIVVDPSFAKLTARGATKQFHAVVRDAQGRILTGVPITWTSSNPAVATIDASTGRATAVANGKTTITAASGGVSGTALLEVYQIAVKVIVLPETATLQEIGATQPFTAQARDANGHVIPGATFSWSSSDRHVATVSSTGLARAVDFGIAYIRATTGGITGKALLKVECPPHQGEP